MRSKSIKEGPNRVFVLILDQGEEAFAAITEFANRERIDGASITAVGAFSEAKVGWFDLAARKYKPIVVKEQCEVLSLIGDVAQGDDGKASLHLHAVLGLQDGSLRGGHFLSGSVQPTLEVTITETVEHLRRKRCADLGIALISIQQFASTRSGHWNPTSGAGVCLPPMSFQRQELLWRPRLSWTSTAIAAINSTPGMLKLSRKPKGDSRS